MKSIAEIKQICGKKVQKDPGHLKLYRWLSWPITAVICDLPITANMVTIFSYFLYFVACGILVIAPYPYDIIASLFIYAALTLDYVDGNIARYKGQSKLGGSLLDSIGHSFIPAILIVAIGFAAISHNIVYYSESTIGGLYLICTFVSSFFFLAGRELSTKKDYLAVAYTKAEPTNSESGFNLLGRPTLHIYELILICAIFNVLNWLIIFYAVFLPLKYFGSIVFYMRSLNRRELRKANE